MNKKNTGPKTCVKPGFRNGALTVIEDSGQKRKNDGARLWLCKCDCGKETLLATSQLSGGTRRRSVKSCGCQIYPKYLDQTLGKTFNQVKVLRYLRAERVARKSKKHVKNKDFYWNHIFECECLECGEIFERNGSKLYERTVFQTCGCGIYRKGENRYNFNGFKDIPGSHITKMQQNARKRNIPWKLKNEDLWSQWKKQGGAEGGVSAICALSGRPIKFADINANDRSRYTKHDTTASLDRKKSEDGDYEKGNIQWVHKDFQAMKMKLEEEDFFKMCEEVAGHQKNK